MPTTIQSCGWSTRLSIAACIRVWTTALLWLVTRSAWASVLILGVCLGSYLLQNWILNDEMRQLQDEAQMLKTQVAMLRDKLNEMKAKTDKDESTEKNKKKK